MLISRRASLIPMIAACIWASLAVGCGPSVIVKEGTVDPSDTNLNTLGRIYVQAEHQLGHPPRKADELKPFAKDAGDLSQLLISPNDNEPYVVVWGTSVASSSDPSVVFAYERAGVNGVRHVLTPTGTTMLTDADFAKASFPRGHMPPGR
jgi:hypothetical protein